MVTPFFALDIALVGLFLAGDHAEERRLAGAVGADEADLLALVERCRGLDEEDAVAVLLADVFDADHGGNRSKT
jgi:class 3 adenylate cyclase